MTALNRLAQGRLKHKNKYFSYWFLTQNLSGSINELTPPAAGQRKRKGAIGNFLLRYLAFPLRPDGTVGIAFLY